MSLAAPSIRSPDSLLATADRSTGIWGLSTSLRNSFAAGDVKLVFCSASDRYRGKVGSRICTKKVMVSNRMSSPVMGKYNGLKTTVAMEQQVRGLCSAQLSMQ